MSQNNKYFIISWLFKQQSVNDLTNDKQLQLKQLQLNFLKIMANNDKEWKHHDPINFQNIICSLLVQRISLYLPLKKLFSLNSRIS